MMQTHTRTKPMIIAHRGYRARYPENTMAAFQAAFDLGVPMIEFDVTLTRDGHVVVIHDETLDRTSNGSGRVLDHSLSELAGLDAGSWFSPHFRGEKIPTLHDVLDCFGKKIELNIEIKPEAFEENDFPGAKTIERQVIAAVRDLSHLESVMISSFHPGVVQRISQMDIPGLRLSYLTEHVKLDNSILDFMIQNRVFSWNPDFPVLTSEHISKVHKHHIRVFTYTVNRASAGRKCMEMGVDGLFTDEPKLFGF